MAVSVRFLVRTTLLVTALMGGSAAHADPASDSASEAEALVRAIYYEGIPYERARALDAAGVARLAEMLADRAELAHRGNIVLALGMSGLPGAFEALSSYASSPPTGEVGRAEFRARTRVARAMGYLCHDDSRALTWLVGRVAQGAATPGWSFRQHRLERLATVLEEEAVSALAMSGSTQALTILTRARQRAPGSDVASIRRRRMIDANLALHARVVRDGASALRSHSGAEVLR